MASTKVRPIAAAPTLTYRAPDPTFVTPRISLHLLVRQAD